MNDISHSFFLTLSHSAHQIVYEHVSSYKHFYEIVSFHIIHCIGLNWLADTYSLSLFSFALPLPLLPFYRTTDRNHDTYFFLSHVCITSIRILCALFNDIRPHTGIQNWTMGEHWAALNGYHYCRHLWLAVSTMCEKRYASYIYSIDRFLRWFFLRFSTGYGLNKSAKLFIYIHGSMRQTLYALSPSHSLAVTLLLPPHAIKCV